MKHPQSNADPVNFGDNLKRNGDSASEARTILEEVAADGVRDSFIIDPNGKLVPVEFGQSVEVRSWRKNLI